MKYFLILILTTAIFSSSFAEKELTDAQIKKLKALVENQAKCT